MVCTIVSSIVHHRVLPKLSAQIQTVHQELGRDRSRAGASWMLREQRVTFTVPIPYDCESVGSSSFERPG